MIALPLLSDSPSRSRAAASDRVETARLCAVLMLILFHVVGDRAGSGLRLDDGHPLRLFVGALSDVRMPLFAMIGGFVYGMRPVKPQDLAGFQLGKLRRLAVPGVTAITLFMVASLVLGTQFAPGQGWWRNYVYHYAHFWYLQSVLVIFTVVVTVDILSRGRLIWALFAGAVVLYLTGVRLDSGVMTVNGALYLAPFFLGGVLLCRHQDDCARHSGAFCAALALSIVLVWIGYRHHGGFVGGNRDLQSLLIGLSVPALCLMYLPALPGLRGFGGLSFTIYLYHVFGSSGARRGLEALGVDQLWLLLPAGVICGVAVPAAIHWLAGQNRVARCLVLGKNPGPLKVRRPFPMLARA